MCISRQTIHLAKKKEETEKKKKSVPGSDYHDAFRRHYSACALGVDQDSDLLTVT